MAYSVICNSVIQYGEVYAGGRVGSLLVNGVSVVGNIPYCSTGWIQIQAVPPFSTSQIDPSVVAALFGGGFVLYITPWAIAWGASQLLKLIR